MEDLIAKIVEYHTPRDLIQRLESLPPNSRPRTYLASFAEELPSRDADYDVGTVETAMRYLFLTVGPYNAMLQCCCLRPMICLYQDTTGEDRFDPRTSHLAEVVRGILKFFGVPTPGAISLDLFSPSEAIARVVDIEQKLMKSVDVQRLDSLQVQGGTINAWTLVERVLKLSMAYFSLHFANVLPNKLFDSFKKELRKGSAGKVVQAFREMETFFKKGELDSNVTARRRKIHEELERVGNPKERATLRKVLEEREKQIQGQKMQLARQLRDACWRDFGRESPFYAIDTSQYQQIISLQRNDFAHKPIERILTQPDGLERVRESLHQAREVIEHLRLARAVPRIVVVMGMGSDNYGNRVIWFTERRWRQGVNAMPQEWEWMYVTSGKIFEPFQRLALLAPDVPSAQKEPLVDPVEYPIQRIQAFIEQS